MNWDLFFFYLLDNWKQTQTIEIIAVCFSVLQVLLAYKNNILLYPAGIIATGIYTWLYAQPEPGLYAEASLNLYYFAMSIYGWTLWKRSKGKEDGLRISSWNLKERKITLLIFLIAFVLLYFVLHTFTDSTVPIMDAFISAAAWAGMWLLAKRKIQNWIVLNISNAIAIPLLFYKQMPLTGLLTLFLFIIAIFGYFKWKKIMSKEDHKIKNSIHHIS